MPHRRFIPALALLLALLACNLPGRPGDSAGDEPGLRLGDPVEVLSTTVPPAGGTIRVDQPESPIDGLAIDVPAGAYAAPTAFTIRVRQILSHTYGERLQPLTPLIEIDNGGLEAQTHLIVHLPADLPPDSFAMAFRYDRESGRLEGLPVLSIDGGEVQVPVLHFSELVLTWVEEELLTQPITTRFVLGRDNWPFPNDGSVVQPAGHCAGETLSALYYLQMIGGEPLVTAFDGYDNGFRRTPELAVDDRLGWRLSSAAQAINRVEGSNARLQYWLTTQSRQPRLALLTFALTMWLTGEPQLVQLQGAGEAAHAVLAYAVNGTEVSIYDPNHPTEPRTLTYLPAEHDFAAYTTGLTSKGALTTFSEVYFIPAREAIDWAALGGLWREFLGGSVGQALFPSYTLWAQGAAPGAAEARRALTDGFRTQADRLRVTFESPGFQGRAVVYNDSPQAFEAILSGQTRELELEQGTTTLGFEIEAEVSQGVFRWVDFRWIDIVRGEAPTETQPPAAAPAGDWSIEDCNALPFLRITSSEPQSMAIGGGTTCNLTIDLENTHAEHPIMAFYFRRAEGTHGESVVEDWLTAPLDPGQHASLALHRTMHEGEIQDATDATLIGAVFADWDSGPGCRWIWQDPEASGFPFLPLENSCR